MSRCCLFCGSSGPFTMEHIVPESLGNKDLVLENHVCRKCNAHFGKIEQFVLQKTSLGFWRVMLGIRSKKGALPSVNFSQPNENRGRFPSIHHHHDQRVGFTAHEDGSVSVDIDSSDIVRRLLSGEKSEFRFVMTPKLLFQFGRFFCKVGIELVCLKDSNEARHDQFERARSFARFGRPMDLWPLFYYTSGDIRDLRRAGEDEHGPFEEVDLFSYNLLHFKDRYVLFKFCVGTENWIVCLNDPFPTPEIREAFPGEKLECIWYSPSELE